MRCLVGRGTNVVRQQATRESKLEGGFRQQLKLTTLMPCSY